jgi:hypothetical protein
VSGGYMGDHEPIRDRECHLNEIIVLALITRSGPNLRFQEPVEEGDLKKLS